MNVRAFRRNLLAWYDTSRRDLPWRETADAYRVWVSEIMLQQTRVAAVIPFYERFLRRFPNPRTLARAGDAELLAAWSGLGYYSRVRNMRRAAVAMKGAFPATYEGIRELPGVGDYTAAAVSSIAFGLPYPAIDGNALRVLARLGNDAGAIELAATRARLACEAARLLDPERPGDFNQAVMELGATVCLPASPKCPLCPVARHCGAHAAGSQTRLPVKRRAAPSRAVERTLLIVRRGEAFLFRRRDRESPILAGFWDLPELEQAPEAQLGAELGSFRHSITNTNYRFRVLEARAQRRPVSCRWLAPDRAVPLSTVARKALRLAGVEFSQGS